MTVFLNQPWRRISLSLLLSGLILSCSPLNPFGLAFQEYVSINTLSQLSNQRVVYLKGIVVNLAPFLEGGAYQLQDATGAVWIKTDKPLPKKGTALTVKGELAYQAIFVGQDKLGESYVLEIEQQPETASVILPPTATNQTQTPGVQAQMLSPESAPSPGIELAPSPTPVPSASVLPSPAPFPSPTPSPSPSPSPSAPSVKIPVPNPGIKPSPKSSPQLSVQSTPNPSSKVKFNPDERFLPHKELSK
jgi:hypothetical protein